VAENARREKALRRLPLVYSLVLRLREAGVAPEQICDYVNVDMAALDNIFRMAEAKLRAAELSEGIGL
jgi:hypothetical protein